VARRVRRACHKEWTARCERASDRCGD
jgi:hypothetical protein